MGSRGWQGDQPERDTSCRCILPIPLILHLFLQPELSRTLYPTFLHCYLHLVSKDATAMASALLNK